MQTDAPTERDQKQSVRDHFGPAAAHYATASVHRRGPDLDALVESIVHEGFDRALDVGTGAGHTALQIAPHVNRVDALDLTQPMLDQVERLARERGLTNVQTRLGDAEAIPFPDQSFEIVTCRLCAHHFQNPARALAEMFRVLAPGGRLALIDIVAPEAPQVDTFLNTFELIRDASHVRDHTPSQWRAMLGDAGFEIDHVTSWSMRIEFDAWVARIGAPPEACAALRFLFGQASGEVRVEFELNDRFDFSLTNALFLARKQA